LPALNSEASFAADDDDALIARIAGGDAPALSLLYDRHSPLIYSILLRVLRNRAEADDLLIDVFQEFWQRANRFDASRSSVTSYLAMLARSRAVDRLRSNRARPTVPLDPAFDTTESNASDPSQRAQSDEQAGQLRRAVTQLSDEQRQAIECAFFDGLSHTEIAERLGKPLGTVKTHIRQGIIRLRDVLRISIGQSEETKP